MYSGYEYCYGVGGFYEFIYSTRHHNDTAYCLAFKNVFFLLCNSAFKLNVGCASKQRLL